jgi:hypothetical protein
VRLLSRRRIEVHTLRSQTGYITRLSVRVLQWPFRGREHGCYSCAGRTSTTACVRDVAALIHLATSVRLAKSLRARHSPVTCLCHTLDAVLFGALLFTLLLLYHEIDSPNSTTFPRVGAKPGTTRGPTLNHRHLLAGPCPCASK